MKQLPFPSNVSVSIATPSLTVADRRALAIPAPERCRSAVGDGHGNQT